MITYSRGTSLGQRGIKKHEVRGVKLFPFKTGDEREVSGLVYSSLDTIVSRCRDYNARILSFLKHLYTPDRILHFATGDGSENHEISLARVDNRLSWVASYDVDSESVEMGMFYGVHTPSGFRSAKRLLRRAHELVLENDVGYVRGKVLTPAARFVERYGAYEDGLMETFDPQKVEDIDPASGETVRLNITPFRYYPEETLLFV